jgi:hypothetical protein
LGDADCAANQIKKELRAWNTSSDKLVSGNEIAEYIAKMCQAMTRLAVNRSLAHVAGHLIEAADAASAAALELPKHLH